MQKLLHHIAIQVILYLREVVKSYNNVEKRFLILINKWVCEESQKMQNKMKFESEAVSYSSNLQICVIPVQLIYESEKKIF